MNKLHILLTATLISAWIPAIPAQEPYLILSYDNVIALAQGQSPAALRTKTERENDYWQWKAFNSKYLPQLALGAELPGYRTGNKPVVQSDGTIEYRTIEQMNSSGNLAATQLLSLTGGSFFINSNLEMAYDFTKDSIPANYNFSPLLIGFTQPLLKFNEHRWNRKIENLKLEESNKQYYLSMEQISINATRLFFNLMIAQIEYEISEVNLNNNDTIYKIAMGRYELGKIAENEYLQIELQYLKSQQELEQAKMDIKNYQLALKNYLGLKEDREVVLLLPDVIYTLNINPFIALDKAKSNRPEILQFERQRIEAEKNLRKAKLDNGINADLSVRYGLSAAPSKNYTDIMKDVGPEQYYNVLVSIPILDWGRAKSEKNQTRENLELRDYTIEQELITFKEEIITQVNYFHQTRSQVNIAKKADEIAEKRYSVAKNRYMIGNISITDINIATQEKDQARKSYINALKNYWLAYYELRKLTLYDFLLDKEIFPSE